MAEKFRIRFRKHGDLRFLSHHDLLRAFERMLRRAELPFRSTEGFHPKPKMAFASALGLGLVGHQEVVEIEFEDGLSAADVQRRLAEQAPPGLDIVSVIQIDRRLKGQPIRAEYRMAIPPEQRDEVRARAEELLQQTHCWVDRRHPRPRRVDIRPYLLRIDVEADALIMEVRITPGGSTRPEEIAELLGLQDWVRTGVTIERTRLDLEDECRSESASESPAAVATQPKDHSNSRHPHSAARSCGG